MEAGSKFILKQLFFTRDGVPIRTQANAFPRERRRLVSSGEKQTKYNLLFRCRKPSDYAAPSYNNTPVKNKYATEK